MRVLVTASRRLVDETAIRTDLTALAQLAADSGERLTVIHGDADGGDTIAGRIASELGANCYRFPAEWDYWESQGKRQVAGALRNIEMQETMQPDVVLAYPQKGSRGTRDCIAEAERRGIAVLVKEQPG